MTIGLKIILVIIVIFGLWYGLSNREAIVDFIDKTQSQNTIRNLSTDTMSVEEVFEAQLESMKNCDIELADSLMSKESKKIVHFTCSNMANERKCYIDKKTEIHTKENTAMLYFPPFNYDSGWPYFFIKEDGAWKIDTYEMANGITMLGGGCDTGWRWRNTKTRDKFCSFFSSGECPDKSF
jgi:hypothetical protein